MQELRHIRRIELIYIVSLVTLHTGWRLYMEFMHYDSMLTIDLNSQYGSLTSYHFWLNTIFPIIARTVLILSAWYIFHYLLYPKIKAEAWQEKTFWYAVMVIFLLTAGVFLYYYFKISLRIVIDHNTITNIRTYSEYRKLYVFSDTVGFLIIIAFYAGSAQQFYRMHQQLSSEEKRMARFLSYFFVACTVIFLTILFTLVPLPTPLWQNPIAHILLTGGVFLLIHILYILVLNFLLPNLQWTLSAKFISYIGIYLFISVIGMALLWGCFNQFQGFSKSTFVVYIIVLLLSWGIAYAKYSSSQEKTILQTQVSAKSAELSSLRSQINPHFLFNALNSLYATALKEKSDKTADGIQKLGDMMRFMLEENNQERIPLDKEIEYLHNYIDIQRMRIDESQGVEIRINIQQPEKEIYIAPMMLNPFVENAFKHGVSLQHPSWIYITLTLDATRVYFKVHNSLHAKAADDPEENSSGVGLANVKKRLELLYPGRYILDIQQSDKDYFVALTLTYETKNA
ncbi:sensor protein lytS [Rhodocytophaga rosea]|uniref:Sensor protein lytS n=1 Tax=Rhodocytophaga rosea TaxID=2704465 RepID=A0A6C0GQY5_9BACT|nr:histidine kinase [Rhodocytophaga rosea]QHT70495.1 sensor protein lytS [Rhodocytophaga rosea]